MDIPLTTEQVGIIKGAYEYVGFGLMQVRNLDVGLEHAASGGGGDADAAIGKAVNKLNFWQDILEKLRIIDEETKKNPILTEHHQQLLVEIKSTMKDLTVLLFDIPSLCTEALDGGVLGEGAGYKLDRTRHQYVGRTADARLMLNEMLKALDVPASNQAPHPLINPDLGKPKGL